MARRLLSPHAGIRVTSTDALLAHYKCDEASGDLIDAVGGYDLTAVNAPGAQTGLFRADGVDGTGARSLNGSTQAFVATVDQDAVDVFKSPYAVTGHLVVDAVGSLQVVFCAGGTPGVETLAENLVLRFSITAAGEAELLWETGSGVNTTLTTSGLALQAADEGMWAIRASEATSGADDEFDIAFVFYRSDGERFSQAWTDQPRPEGGTANRRFAVGRNGNTSADYFDGAVDDIGIWKFPLDDDAFEWLFAESWATDYDEEQLYEGGFFDTHTRVRIEDENLDLVDVTNLFDLDFLEALSFGDQVDDQGAHATIELRRRIEEWSLAPFMQSSPVNVEGGGTFLQLNRRVVVSTAISPHGFPREAIWNWSPAFVGLVSDWSDDSRPTLKVEAFDNYQALQDAFIEPDRSTTPPTEYEYGQGLFPDAGTDIIPELQQIIDDNEDGTVGYPGGKPTIYAKDDPLYEVNRFSTPSDKSVGQQFEDLMTKRLGWVLRYRWDDNVRAFRLTLYEPPRNRTWQAGDLVIRPGQVLNQPRQLSFARDDLRNVIEVEFGGALDVAGAFERDTVIAENTTSITKYRSRRYARIGIESTAGVNTQAGAERLRDNALSDLSDPLAHFEASILFRHDIELDDMIKFEADGEYFDEDVEVAVTGWDSELNKASRRTKLQCRLGPPAGKSMEKWGGLLVLEGFISGLGLTPPDPPTSVSAIPAAGGMQLTWDFPAGGMSQAYMETEVHINELRGFTPSEATLPQIVRGRHAFIPNAAPGVEQNITIRHRDRMNNVSAASAMIQAQSWYTSLPVTLPRAEIEVDASDSHTYGTSFEHLSPDQGDGSATNVIENVGSHVQPDILSLHVPGTGRHRFAVFAGFATGGTTQLALYVDSGSGYALRRLGPVGPSSSSGGGHLQCQLLLNQGDDVRIYVKKGSTGGRLGVGSWYEWDFAQQTEDILRGALEFDVQEPEGSPYSDTDPISLLTNRGCFGSADAAAAGAARPVYDEDGINGLPAADFNGSGHLLDLGAGALRFSRARPGYTLLAVVQPDTDAAGTDQIISVSTNGSAILARALLARNGTTWELGGRRSDGDSYDFLQAGTVAVDTPVVLGGTIDFATTTAHVYIDGVLTGTDTGFLSAGLSDDTESDSVFVGGRTGGEFFSGLIGRVIAIPRAVDADEMEILSALLADAYGL